MKKIYFKKFITIAIALLLTISMVACGKSTKNESEEASSNRDKLIVGLSADYAPYEFHAMIDGKDTVVGFDVDLAKEIAKDMNCDLVIKEMEFNNLITALKAGQIDLIISGMNPTEERKKEIDFSDIYYQSQHSVLVRADEKDKYKNLSDLDGKKIGVQLGTTQQDFVEENIKYSDLQILSKVPKLVLELKTEKIDALVTEAPVVSSAIKNNPELVLSDIKIETDDTGNAVGIRKGNDELREKVNSTIKRLKESGEMDDFIVKANELSAENQDQSFLTKYSSVFLSGLKITLEISLITVFLGTILGAILFFMKSSQLSIFGIKPLKWIANIYIEIIRGTPMLLQIMLVYSGSKMVLGLDITAFLSAVIAISLNSAAYVSEIVRAGIEAVDKGQMEAARSLGMSKALAMKEIIIPQAVKNILPAIGNEFVAVIKESSMASVIGVGELMFAANIVTGATFMSIEPLAVSAVLYFILTFSLGRLMGYFERRMKASDSR